MQLSPLQSRLVASIIATCILLVLYLLLLSPQFASAAELAALFPDGDSDTDIERWLAEQEAVEGRSSSDVLDLRSPTYEPEFALFDRSIIGRAGDITSLANNAPMKTNLNPNSSVTYVFPMSSLSGRGTQGTAAQELRRSVNDSQDLNDGNGEDSQLVRREPPPNQTLYLSANTCIQPQWAMKNMTMQDPPQITLYVSTSSSYTSPGPSGDDAKQTAIPFVEGAVMYEQPLEGDVYFSVAAPVVSKMWSPQLYNVEIAASVDRLFHSYSDPAANSSSDLVWVDSDQHSSLLESGYLTSNPNATVSESPYAMYAWAKNSTSVRGLTNSYCGLREYAEIGGSASTLPINMISTSLLNTGLYSNTTRQMFYVNQLNSSTNYMGILVRQPGMNTTVSKRQSQSIAGGGGTVFQATEFDTKSSGACTIIFNLTFCNQTAYAVPGNTSTFSTASALAEFYDDYAKTMYGYFENAMAQIPCDTVNTSRYSLARGCDDCKSAYKNWLCSVSIPRCEDFTATDSWLQMRNIMAPFQDGSSVPQDIISQYGNMWAYNSSRLPLIDSVVQPGPYKEVLPCDDMCYDIVQSCPSALGFGCPQMGMYGYNTSYGQKDKLGNSSSVTCNYPGAAHTINAAALDRMSWVVTVASVGSTMLLLLL